MVPHSLPRIRNCFLRSTSHPCLTTMTVASYCLTTFAHFSIRYASTEKESKHEIPDVPAPNEGRHHTPIVSQLWSQRSSTKSYVLDSSPDSNLSETLSESRIEKSVQESRIVVDYPFGVNKILTEDYTNPWGSIRMGRMFEDLDALAGNVAWAHVLNGSQDRSSAKPLHLVTASVDRIVVNGKMDITKPLRMKGSVSWTGTSSMEIRVIAFCPPQPETHLDDGNNSDHECSPWLEANFVYVARDPSTGRAAQVNPLKLFYEHETALFKMAQRRHNERKQRKKEAQARKGAAALGQEVEMFHIPQDRIQLCRELLERSRMRKIIPALTDTDTVFLSQTQLSNTFMTELQHRNPRGHIFGGFLMRRALEIAFSAAYLFAGSQPAFYAVDEITFHHPVNVGNILQLQASVLHHQNLKLRGRNTNVVHVEVIAWIVSPEARSTKMSNKFNLCFTLDQTVQPLKTILPSTLDEANRMVQVMLDDLP